MSTTITLTIEVDVPDQQCWDVLTCAVEGGIGYWSTVRNIVRSEADRSVMKVDIAEDEDFAEKGPDGATWHTMLAADVRRGIEALSKMIGASIHPGSTIGVQFMECLHDEEYGFAAGDAILADAIVQVALFDELVYA